MLFTIQIRTIEEMDIASVADLTTRDAKSRITIERKPKKIARIWNKFVDYFEVSNDLKLA